MALNPRHTYVSLANDGTAEEIPGDAFWQLPAADIEQHGQGWLISEFAFTEDWPTWEMHPHGAGAVVVPRGVWHTARVLAPSRMLHVTRGAGTETRPASAPGA